MNDIELHEAIEKGLKIGRYKIELSPRINNGIINYDNPEILVYDKGDATETQYTIEEAITKAVSLNIEKIRIESIGSNGCAWLYGYINKCKIIITTTTPYLREKIGD